MKIKIIVFIILVTSLIFSNNTNVDLIAIPKSELVELVKTSKLLGLKAMYYDDLLINMRLHFYTLATKKLELESGERFTFTYNLYQKKSKYNNFTEPLIFTFDFVTENNSKAVLNSTVDLTYVWVGMGAFVLGVLSGGIFFVLIK